MGRAAPALLAAAIAAAAPAVADMPAREAAERLAEREAVARAAARFGCEAKELKRLSTPHDGVWEARCRDSLILWLHRVDDIWTVKPIG